MTLIQSVSAKDMTKKELHKRILKLESKLEELLDYLKLEAVSEEEKMFHGKETYYNTLITKKKKDDW